MHSLKLLISPILYNAGFIQISAGNPVNRIYLKLFTEQFMVSFYNRLFTYSSSGILVKKIYILCQKIYSTSFQSNRLVRQNNTPNYTQFKIDFDFFLFFPVKA